jgi:hypothetical protein
MTIIIAAAAGVSKLYRIKRTILNIVSKVAEGCC